MLRLLLSVAILAVSLSGTAVAQTLTVAPGNEFFDRTWQRPDKPVLDGVVSRTWMWAPEAFTEVLSESYAESPGGNRSVQYFDKARMEITQPDGVDPGSVWYVTNGLLVVEMTTGQLQLGDATFEQRGAALINVAGDGDDPNGPTYTTFGQVADEPPAAVGAALTQRIDRSGTISDDPALTAQGVTAAVVDEVTNHAIAAPFWEFMNSTGVVYENGQYITAPLFENPYFATGRPISEGYWANVKVAGTQRDVFIQCFERRCLTFTPGNPEGFEVEAGNVGRHYYEWRYSDSPPQPDPEPDPDPTPPTPGGPPAEGAILYQSSLGDWPATGDGVTTIGEPTDQANGYVMAGVPESAVYAFHGTPYGDASYEVKVLSIADSGDVAGCLAIRVTELGAYHLCVAFSGPAAVGTISFYLDLASEELIELGVYEFDPILPSEQFHTIKIVTQGNQYWFYANEQMVGTATHGSGGSGFFGVGMICIDPLFVCAVGFTDIVVRSVGEGSEPPPSPDPTPEPPPAGCHPSYPDHCIAPPPPQLSCGDLPTSWKPIRVLHNVPNPDPHRFDQDEDGWGCESG